jgi:hypothetical protein
LAIAIAGGIISVSTESGQAHLLLLLIERVEYDGKGNEVAITFRPAGIASLAREQKSAA